VVPLVAEIDPAATNVQELLLPIKIGLFLDGYTAGSRPAICPVKFLPHTKRRPSDVIPPE